MITFPKLLMASAAGFATLATSAAVFAAPCPALPNPIYGSGGSAATATIGRIAAALRSLPEPITVFYHDPGACFGFDYFIRYVKNGDSVIDTTPAPATVKYWEADGTQRTCDAPSLANPIPLDFAHMGNQSDFCLEYPDGLPDGIGDFPTPVQTMNFITDKDSDQKAISAAALFHIFGLGAAAANVQPWNVPSHIVLRTTGAFAHQFPSVAVFAPELGYDAALAKVFYDHPSNGAGRLGYPAASQGEVIREVIARGATNARATLGYVSGNAADTSTGVKTLAYQHWGQSCAYWPSSSESALDKINVRQGLYALWTPGHLFAPTDDEGNVVVTRGADDTENAAIAERLRNFIGYFGGTLDSPPGVNPPILERVIRAGDVPLCAMQVAREGTFGAVRSEAPAEPCGCYFEAVATGNASACRSCSENDPCSDGKVCRHGYCEDY